MPIPVQAPLSDPGLCITRLLKRRNGSQLAADLVEGFSKFPRGLPPKYFYDQRGAKLFDAICDTPEYYPTRTEQALLEQVAPRIIRDTRPTHLVELGSGAARKTRTLLDALLALRREAWYVPVDISEEMLIASAQQLLSDYPRLRVHGVVADYDHHLHLLPNEGRRLIAFLGSTIGNFSQPAAVRFLRALASGMNEDDRLLIGLDLVKPAGVLHAAYNDAAGLTAAFNLNVLEVINRELGADFDLDSYRHVACYLPEQKQIEMYLESQRAQIVNIDALRGSYAIGAGERIRTEISRKFDDRRAQALAQGAGLEIVDWHRSPDDYFALMVAARA